MKGKHSTLVVTQTVDEATGDLKPLFAFPVQIAKATGSTDVRFDLAAPSGAKYETVYRDLATGEAFDASEKLRGVRTGDSFAAISDDQIKAIDEALKSTEITVERSVDLDSVPFHLARDVHYLQVPSKGGSAKHYRLLYEGLLARPKKGKVAARPAKALRVKYVATTRQKLGVIYADPTLQALVMVTLTFAADVRAPDEQVLTHLQAEVDEPMVAKVREVIEVLDDDGAGGFDEPVDEAIAQREELLTAALAGEAIEAPAVADSEVVAADDISAALEASLV